MGKKSRLKRERCNEQELIDRHEQSPLNPYMTGDFFIQNDQLFQKHVDATRALLECYVWKDVAVALNVSELWPANTASPLKHLFAWRIFVGSQEQAGGQLRIENYDAFCDFLTKLYGVLPDFPELEDYAPEPDWGAVKVRLRERFRPIFYGSCIERTSDFIEAFRITYADLPKAQAQMDLVVAMQAHIIESLPTLTHEALPQISGGDMAVPPQEFWEHCQSTILQLGSQISDWLNAADRPLEIGFGTLTMFPSGSDFRNAATVGGVLPYIAFSHHDQRFPISLRSAPSVLIDYWAKKDQQSVSDESHQSLGHFVSRRFRQTLVGPLSPMFAQHVVKNLRISAVINTNHSLYLICLVGRKSYISAVNAAKKIEEKLRANSPFLLIDSNGRYLSLQKTDLNRSGAVRILLVLEQSGTALSSVTSPEPPIQMLPLADFITIFDSIQSLEELEDYWSYVENNRKLIRSIFLGHADLFASFRDTHSVLIDGAVEPNMIMLDPHWGTNWRFNALCEFWSNAPAHFPDESSEWLLHPTDNGVVELGSRCFRAYAYSMTINTCTVQVLIRIKQSTTIDDGKMIDMFGQLITDTLYRCRTSLNDLPMLQYQHIVLDCIPDPANLTTIEDDLEDVHTLQEVITSLILTNVQANELRFTLKLNTRSILAGLSDAKNATFEIRCLNETLFACHQALSLELPLDFSERFEKQKQELPRYHLKIVERTVDVPDYANPSVPSPKEYKLARKKLALFIRDNGLIPGRYELSEAKIRIDKAKEVLRRHIEDRLSCYDQSSLIGQCIELHDTLLTAERLQIQRAQHSLVHQVDYDRLDAIEKARSEFGSVALNCRYLLEKVASLGSTGTERITTGDYKELVALVDWYMVLASASDTLHNGVDVAGVDIDESYVPDVFYSSDASLYDDLYSREQARFVLGHECRAEDVVEGAAQELLTDPSLANAFVADIGFELKHLLQALTILTQAHQHGFGDALSWSYACSVEVLTDKLHHLIEDLNRSAAERIVRFLTLSGPQILQLTGKDVMEGEVPFWEHIKRAHRYTIRPLVEDAGMLRWGAEHATRTRMIWLSTVREGFLPLECDWPTISPLIGRIKADIEKRLEVRAEEIFKRHTKYVLRGIDFKKRFRSAGFDDVGDFDVFAYWPEINKLVTVECKNNQPPHTIKDSRRLRDKIFGKSEDDRAGQLSRILGRRHFVERNRMHLFELLGWPVNTSVVINDNELYVSRQMYYWMINPPYPVPTDFVRIDALNSFIEKQLLKE